jgi:Spy/CpxP family protein refolding chaperone
LDKMTKELNLTPEQKEKIEAIMKAKAEKNKAEMEKMRESMKAEMDATTAQIKEVLTPEQQVKFDKLQEEKKGKMCGHGKKHNREMKEDKTEEAK